LIDKLKLNETIRTVIGQIAVKVINHYGDEVLKVYGVG